MMNPDNLRVCFIVNTLSETNPVYDLTKALADHTDIDGIEIIVWFKPNYNVFNSTVGENLFSEYDTINVTWLEETSIHGLHYESFIQAQSVIRKCDLIQTHHTPSEVYGKFLGKIEDVPIIQRDGNVHHGYSRVSRIARGLSNILVNKIVCVSDPVRNSFKNWENFLIREKKCTIPNGVDFDRLHSERSKGWLVREEFDIDPGAILVGNVGKFEVQKAHDVLIRAVGRVNNRMDRSVELVIAGDGQRRPELKRITEQCSPDCVHLLGAVKRKKVYSMLDQIDIFVMPSRWEGFSNAALQAMGSGLPCVFTDIPPFKQPFDNSAIFVPVDDIIKLSDEILKLSKNPEKREYYGQLAEETVQNKYTAQGTAKDYLDLYQSLAK